MLTLSWSKGQTSINVRNLRTNNPSHTRGSNPCVRQIKLSKERNNSLTKTNVIHYKCKTSPQMQGWQGHKPKKLIKTIFFLKFPFAFFLSWIQIHHKNSPTWTISRKVVKDSKHSHILYPSPLTKPRDNAFITRSSTCYRQSEQDLSQCPWMSTKYVSS